MTKLEQKLIELGYEKDKQEYSDNVIYKTTFVKYFKYCCIHVEIYNIVNNNYHFCIETFAKAFAFQEFIDNLQQAFNTMQNDLEILKECEE